MTVLGNLLLYILRLMNGDISTASHLTNEIIFDRLEHPSILFDMIVLYYVITHP